MLTALEGIQEQYSMTFQEKSTLVDELMQSSKEQLSEQGMIETFSKLEVLSKLLSSSRFADIEQKRAWLHRGDAQEGRQAVYRRTDSSAYFRAGDIFKVIIKTVSPCCYGKACHDGSAVYP